MEKSFGFSSSPSSKEKSFGFSSSNPVCKGTITQLKKVPHDLSPPSLPPSHRQIGCTLKISQSHTYSGWVFQAGGYRARARVIFPLNGPPFSLK